jgi:sec-independent protein translocase protein TatA
MTPFLALFGPIGWPEMVLILIVVLIVFGPRRLPEIADALGKSVRKFKSATRDASQEVQRELNEAKRNLEDETPAPPDDKTTRP